MPLHIHPILRALEEAEEAAGLIKSLDSAGVTVQKAVESSGQSPKIIPIAHNYVNVKGTNYTAK